MPDYTPVEPDVLADLEAQCDDTGAEPWIGVKVDAMDLLNMILELRDLRTRVQPQKSDA